MVVLSRSVAPKSGVYGLKLGPGPTKVVSLLSLPVQGQCCTRGPYTWTDQMLCTRSPMIFFPCDMWIPLHFDEIRAVPWESSHQQVCETDQRFLHFGSWHRPASWKNRKTFDSLRSFSSRSHLPNVRLHSSVGDLVPSSSPQMKMGEGFQRAIWIASMREFTSDLCAQVVGWAIKNLWGQGSFI
jgi:hypothetical protein